MADNSDLVIKHLELLHSHRELIAAAFHRGEVDVSADPAGGRGLARLSQAGILRPFLEGTYRLASSLAEHLDEILSIERLYSAAGSDLAELADYLPEIVTSVAEASFQGDIGAADRLINDFDRRVFEITDSISGMLQSVRVQAENNFANVKGHAEKRKQNEFYLERVTRLSEILRAIQSQDLVHALEANPDGARMLETYRSQIADHLPQWRANLLDITKILKDYLFRIRQIERTAKRMRAFELFLRRTPGYVPPDIDDENELPLWACHAEAFLLEAHLDVQDTAHEDLALEIARQIPDNQPVTVATPRIGALLPDEPIEIDEDQARPMLWASAMRQMLDSVGPEPIMAIEWKALHPEYAGISDDAWLVCLLHAEQSDLQRNSGIRFEHITLPVDPIRGNVLLSNVQLSRAGKNAQ